MKVKILGSTNSKIEEFIGEIRNYFRMGNVACLEDLNKPGYGIKTSRIVSEQQDDNIIKIKTMNSIYELEIVED